MRYDIYIFHYFNIYKTQWKRMAFLMVLAVIFTLMSESMKPLTYRSTLIALSSKEGGQAGGLGKYLGFPDFGLGVSSDDIIFSMLKSRRMRKDIDEHFKLKEKPRLWWSLDTYSVTGGFAVEVTGPDPVLTKEITNFAVDNLDKINIDLAVTSQKPMVKVLDSAIQGVPVRGSVSKKALTSALFVFLVYTLFVFFKEYFSQLKRSKNE